MKKSLALLLTVAMLMTTVLAAIPLTASAEETYYVNDDTLSLRTGSGTGLSIGDNGKTVIFNQPESNPSAPAHWSNTQLMAQDDAKDGFTVKISDIKWDEANDNAVAIVYSNAAAPHPSLVSDTESNFTLLVRKDGSIVFWGNGCNSNHIWGKWAGVWSTDKTLGETVTEFTYKMVPNADLSVFSFYVNDLLVYKYDIAEVAPVATNFHSASILANLDKPCNFGFMVLNGTGDWGATGWGTEPVGTLSYRIDKVQSVGEAAKAEAPSIELDYRSGSGTGLSVSGNTVMLNQPASNPSAPAIWSNGQLWANDNPADGFEIKISDIKWDEANDNAVAVIYSNASASPYPAFISDTESNFTLLVRKDGSIVFWGNGCNSNHTWGKWAGVYSLGKTLGETVTEFTYKMVPNADLSVFSFYVNDLLVYKYDIAAVAPVATNFHSASILNNLDKPCNFGFMVLNGTGDWGATGWAKEPVGTLSYKVADVKSAAVAEQEQIIQLEYRSAGGSGLSVSGNTVALNQPASNPEAPAIWSNAQLWANDSAKDGFSVKITDIKWDETYDNAVAIVYSNAAVPHVGQLSDTTSNFTLLVRKDGSLVFWGNGCNSNHTWGKWAGVWSVGKTLGQTVTEFTYKMIPNADLTKFDFYVNDVLVYSYDVAVVSAASASFHSASVLANLDKPCNFGFMVMNGTGDWNYGGWGSEPIGTLSYKVADVNATALDDIDLEYRAAGGSGLSVSGNKVALSEGSSNAQWSNGQLWAKDDASDGFTVKISDIKWDEANDNAVTIVYSNAAAPFVGLVSDTESNFTLLVRKDGSIVFWGNGCNSNHTYGKWAGVYSVGKTLGETVTEFTYKMVPNADKSVYYFFVNDLLVYTYDIAAVAPVATNFHYASILNNLDKSCNFGFMVLNGTGDWGATGWGTTPTGTLSYTVEKIEYKGEIDYIPFESLGYRAAGGTGLSVSGNTVTLSEGSSNAQWSNASLIAKDDIKDGFSVKISDIKWDNANDNAVAIVYGNATTGFCGSVDAPNSCFTLLVRKDGSIVFWGDGNRSDYHGYGKWTSVCITDKTLGQTVDGFTYKMVPNADKSKFTFFVNDIAIYTYDVANANANSIFTTLDTPCNFGFMVLNGTGDWGGNGWSTPPAGTLSYKVAEVKNKGEIDFYPLDGMYLRAAGGTGLSVSGGKITLSEGSSNAQWSNGALIANDDIKDGFEVKISDIKWDDANDNAVAIVYGNASTGYCGSVDAPNSCFTLLVRKDGSIVFWGDGNRSDFHGYGKWTSVNVLDKTLGKTVDSFTYKMVPNLAENTFDFYVNDVLVYSYDYANVNANSIFENLDTPCNFGFMVLNGTGDWGENGWSTPPAGTLSYTVKKVSKTASAFNSALDLDADGAVANSDVSVIVRYLAGWNVSATELDVNGDGKVNNRDAIYLIQYLNGFAIKPITILEGDKSKYTIVVSDYNLKAECAGVYLKEQFLNKTGVDLEITTDWALYDRSSYEIIVGETERLGTQLTSEMKTVIYKDGFVIKALGNRIWIAGENEDATKAGVDYFLENYVVGTNVTLSNELNFVKTSEATHEIESFTISGNAIADYVIECDMSSYQVYALAKKLRDIVWDYAGIDLAIVDKADTGAKKISFTLNAIANGEPTYKIQTNGADLVFYATNIDALTNALDYFLRENVGYISDTDMDIASTVAVSNVNVTVTYDRITSLTIAGKDISEYVIYNTSSAASAGHAASQLQTYLNQATDANLAVVTTAADQPMIKLVYDEAMGENYSLKTDANGLTIKGGENGILYGVYNFLEDYIGWNFLPYNNNVLISEDTVVIDNLDVEYTQYFEFRAPHFGAFQNSWVAAMNMVNGDMGNNRVDLPDYLGSFYGFTGSFTHTLTALLGEEGNGTEPNPCFSSEASYQKIIANVRALLAANPDAQIISVSQNDSGDWCQCDGCTGASIGGNLTDAFLKLVNRVAADVAVDYPNVKIHTLAYGDTQNLPKVITPADNVIVQLCEAGCCYNHALEDPSCEHNAKFMAQLEGWSEICDNLYIWSYTTNNLYMVATYPIFDIIKSNVQTYVKYGVKGVYAQGDVFNNISEFEDLTGYLYAEVMEDPFMTDEEYDALIDRYLQGYYGAGWENIRSYLDFLVESSNKQGCFGVYAKPEAMYTAQDFISREAEIEAYFNAAEEMADNNTAYSHIKSLRTSWNYLKLFFTYDNVMSNGTWAEKQAMRAEASATFDAILEAGYRLIDIHPPLSELIKDYNINKTAHPRNWAPNKHQANTGDNGI